MSLTERIASRFSKAAQTYDDHAVLQREIGQRLMERLDYIRCAPLTIVDAGCGTGECTFALARRFPKAKVFGIDIAQGMIQQAKKKRRWFSKTRFQIGDMSALPFEDNSIDFLFSNLALQWVDDLSSCFREWQRVLKPGGLLLFSTFGVDTLKELRASWAAIDSGTHVNEFIDLHDVGDALLRAAFSQPVMDAEWLTTTYRDVPQLLRELKAIGANTVKAEASGGLMGRGKLKQLMAAYEPYRTEEGWIPATWEVVYGHAWGSETKAPMAKRDDVYIVSLDEPGSSK